MSVDASNASDSFLDISYEINDEASDGFENDEFANLKATRILPFANSPLYNAAVVSAKQLTKGRDVKTVYDITLDLKDINYKFEPGDTIGILPCNDEDEVDQILDRLHLSSVAKTLYNLSVLKETTKKKPAIPSYIPPHGTLRELFINNLDIRSPPKKLFLKSLVRYTTQQEEIEYLQCLCSPRGHQEYNEFITKKRTLLNLLKTFPSCHPPVERLLENLPPLQPRPYSISSSPLLNEVNPELHVTFTVVDTEWGSKGVCSGWLANIAKTCETQQQEGFETVTEKLKRLQLSAKHKVYVPFYFRKINNFRLPVDSSVPIIMIGPGTGIAPFFGFLQHRYLQYKKEHVNFGSAWLFYGCRYSDRDFLYRPELEIFLQNSTLTQLFTCFSRETTEKVYVQDIIKHNGKAFTRKLVHEKAVVYVCGDAKNMTKDVRTAIVLCLKEFEGMSLVDAEDYVMHLQQTNRYVQDTWV